jgi:hypothetical protein
MPLINTTSKRPSFSQESNKLGRNELPKAVDLEPPSLEKESGWYANGALSTA